MQESAPHFLHKLSAQLEARSRRYMAAPTPYPHELRGAVILQTGSVAPGVEATLQHTINGRTVLCQAAYYGTESRQDRTWYDLASADFVMQNVDIAVAGGALQLKAAAESAGTAVDLVQLKETKYRASSNDKKANQAADGDTGTYWYNDDDEGAAGAWWAIECEHEETMYSLEVVWYGSAYVADFRVDTSPDGSTWTAGEAFTGAYGTGTQAVSLAAAATARHFRLLFSNPANSTYVVLREVRMFQSATSSYPTGPAYATSATSLNSTLWDAGLAFSVEVAEAPGVTSARFLCSTDGRATWKYWSGAAWTAGALTAAAWGTASNDAATLEGRSAADWAALVGSGGTFDLAVQLASSDATQTPSVGKIAVSYSTGTFRKIAGDNEVALRQYDDGNTIGVYNAGAVARDFFVTITAIAQP